MRPPTVTRVVEWRAVGVVGVLALLLAFVLVAPASHAGSEPGGGTGEATSPPRSDRESDGESTVTVMARNLYLGADVGVALDLLPDLPAAAQFMWDQVRATDIEARAASFAAEVARERPDVIGLQEATTWACRAGLSGAVPVFDFTDIYLEELSGAGQSYVVAADGEDEAANPGYEIPSIPYATRVVDPETFQPLFGSDEADCGFTLADVLLVREGLADEVLAAGTSEYTTRYAVVPVVFTIDRGYAWADVAVAGTTVRFVTTHAESLFDEDAVPPSADQARQLVDDLASTVTPLVVMGDFNAEPRDPRGPGVPNPAGQPEASTVCPAQSVDPTPTTALPECNGYWTMIAAGYDDGGPAQIPRHYTYGANALLAGPDLDRLPDALAEGNTSGFTDRIDHVFLANGALPVTASSLGGRWPDGADVWECSSPDQVAASEAASEALVDAGLLDRAIRGRGICLPSDHAGIVAVVDVSAGPPGAVEQDPPPSHSSLRLDLLGWLVVALIVLLLVIGFLLLGLAMLVRRMRRSGKPGPDDPGSDEQGSDEHGPDDQQVPLPTRPGAAERPQDSP